MKQKEQDYLSGLIEGDRKIIERIYQLYYPKVRSFILKNKGKEDDVQDVFHDALMYLINVCKEKPLKVQSFEAYFFTICKNLWRRTLKKEKSKVISDETITLINEESELSLFIIEQERLEFYQEKFQLLSDNCKEILSNYFNGMSYEEIVEELSYANVNTVRQRVFKCKAKMIQMIKSDKRYSKLKQ